MGGQKSKPKKSLDQNLTPKKSHDEKISRGTTRPGYAGTVKNLPIVFEYPQNLLKSNYEKNTCQNFPTKKKPEIENFKPIKIFRSSLSLEIRSTPLPPPPAGGTFFLNLHRIGYTVFLGLCLIKLTRIH